MPRMRLLKSFVLQHSVINTKHLRSLIRGVIRGFTWVEMLGLTMKWTIMAKFWLERILQPSLYVPPGLQQQQLLYCLKCVFLKKKSFIMNAPLWVEHLLITFWWVQHSKLTKKLWLRCSTHKGAFIINDFLRNPHFSKWVNCYTYSASSQPYYFSAKKISCQKNVKCLHFISTNGGGETSAR